MINMHSCLFLPTNPPEDRIETGDAAGVVTPLASPFRSALRSELSRIREPATA